MNIEGKRLLILGGTRLMVHVVNVAKELGIYTIVTDMDPKSPAKAVSDKAYDISTRDISAVVEMAQNEHIDGIFVGYDDQNTGYAVEVCSELGLPFYATKEQIDITKNKILFKNTCREFNVPVVREYNLSNREYPCVVKPADSYSAKGITICFNDDELERAIEYAKQFSTKKEFLIEKYMDYSSADCVNIDYLLVDGEIYLTMVGDKLVINQGHKAPLTDAVIYPSMHVEDYINNVDPQVKKMFSSLGMKNGTVFIESFWTEDGFVIYEMGYRVGGGQSSILFDHLYSVDYIKLLIQYSVTGKMTDQDLSSIDPRKCIPCAGIVLLVKPGIIKEIKGLEKIRNISEVINITQYLYEGDKIEERALGTLGQTFARIHLVAESFDKLNKAIQEVRNTIKIVNSDNTDLIVR